MRVLVTGGAGFIGSHLAERMVREGHEVRVLDNFSAGTLANLEPVLQDIEIIEGDIRDLDMATKATDGTDTVFHLAAIGSVPRSIEKPDDTNSANVGGTLNILMAARDAGVKRVVYASSSSVYGDTPTLPKHEGLTTVPVSPYGVSKLAAELYCRSFWKVYGLETICLRYFNVFGARQNPNSQYAAVIPRFISKLFSDQSPVVYGDGQQSRDFTFVENVVEANCLAMHATQGFGDAFNIAAGGQVTVDDLARRLIDLTGKMVGVTYDPPRPGDILHSYADVDKAREVLGYRTIVGLDEGLERTVAWYRSAWNGNKGDVGLNEALESTASRKQ